VRQDAQGFACVRPFLQAGQKVLALWGVAPKERGGFREGPWEVGVADFCAPGPPTVPACRLATLHQAALRGKVRHAGDAVDSVACQEPHAAQNLANAGDGVQQIQGRGVVMLGRFEDKEFEGWA
jgi:hypothetical protein